MSTPPTPSIEISAYSTEEALNKAQFMLGLPPAQLRVETLTEPDTDNDLPGQFRVVSGINANEPLSPEAFQQLATHVLDAILSRMLVNCVVQAEWQENAAPNEEDSEKMVLVLNVLGDGLEDLPGPRGETLSALQYLVRTIVSRHTQSPANIVVDVEGYKAQRAEQLRAMAQRIAEQVITTQKPITLEPMPAYERRVIHITLRENPLVHTQSSGEGDHRKITIYPRK